MSALNKTNFAIAAIAAKPDDGVSAAITGILVSPEGTIASDGHCLVKCSAAEVEPTLFTPPDVEAAEAWTPFILDREAALKVARAFPKRKKDQPEPVAVIDCKTEAGGSAIVQVGDEALDEILRSKKIDGPYPDPARVIPDEKPQFEINIAPDLLHAALKQIVGMGALTVRIKFFGSERALKLEAEVDGQEMVAVVMPQRMAT